MQTYGPVGFALALAYVICSTAANSGACFLSY